jgi:hypothetical protein
MSDNTIRVFAKTFSATYPGDCSNVDRDELVGPNTMREHFRPATAVYDAGTDTTRVVFDLVAPDDVTEHVRRLRDKQRRRLQIAALFGGGRRR